MIIFCLGGYIVYDKFIAKEEVEESVTKTVKKKGEKENLNAIASSLITKLSNYKLEQLDVFDQSYDFTTTPTSSQLYAMTIYFWNQMSSGTSYSDTANMTKGNIDNYFQTVYGVTPTNYPDIYDKDKDLSWSFDSSTNKYISSNEGKGLTVATVLTSNIVSITKEDDNYVLTLSKLFYWNPYYSGSFSLSGSNMNSELSEMSQFIDVQTGELSDEAGAIKYFNDNATTYNTQKPQYKYTFANDNGDYHLIKYEVIN